MSDIKAKRVHTVFVIRKLPKKGKKKRNLMPFLAQIAFSIFFLFVLLLFFF